MCLCVKCAFLKQGLREVVSVLLLANHIGIVADAPVGNNPLQSRTGGCERKPSRVCSSLTVLCSLLGLSLGFMLFHGVTKPKCSSFCRVIPAWGLVFPQCLPIAQSLCYWTSWFMQMFLSCNLNGWNVHSASFWWPENVGRNLLCCKKIIVLPGALLSGDCKSWFQKQDNKTPCCVKNSSVLWLELTCLTGTKCCGQQLSCSLGKWS